jgi:hypothetical protein
MIESCSDPVPVNEETDKPRLNSMMYDPCVSNVRISPFLMHSIANGRKEKHITNAAKVAPKKAS